MKTNAFVRQLASNKRTVRENAIETLKKFLSSKEKANKINIMELNKLWKGLFYSMWFCDKPRPQQRLANQLAKLFSECIIDEQFCNFVESFWNIMNKEWKELDKWRIDKFLMLMRYVIRESFVKLDSLNWDEKFVNSYLKVLTNVVLRDDIKVPRSITFHIVDVWVDELENTLFPSEEDEEEDGSEEKEEKKQESDDDRIETRKNILKEKKIPIEILLHPFKQLSGKGHNEALVNKIRIEILEDERLLELNVDTSLPKATNTNSNEGSDSEEEQEEEEEEEEWKGFGN